MPGPARWEIVARQAAPGHDGLPGLAAPQPPRSWIVPASEGRHYRRTWLAARWTAWLWTRRQARDGGMGEVARIPPFTWEVRCA